MGSVQLYSKGVSEGLTRDDRAEDRDARERRLSLGSWALAQQRQQKREEEYSLELLENVRIITAGPPSKSASFNATT